MKIAIVTDTNSGISEKEAKKLGVYCLPMPFSVDGRWMLEGVDLTAEEFYRRQAAGAHIPSSQPRPGNAANLVDKVLNGDAAVG